MVKNLLAAVGAAVIVKKAYEFYREYSRLKQENQQWRDVYGGAGRGDDATPR